ncbi:hypothetical protein P9112_008555 [Eukaryota sp. TZLM1-RC]
MTLPRLTSLLSYPSDIYPTSSEQLLPSKSLFKDSNMLTEDQISAICSLCTVDASDISTVVLVANHLSLLLNNEQSEDLPSLTNTDSPYRWTLWLSIALIQKYEARFYEKTIRPKMKQHWAEFKTLLLSFLIQALDQDFDLNNSELEVFISNLISFLLKFKSNTDFKSNQVVANHLVTLTVHLIETFTKIDIAELLFTSETNPSSLFLSSILSECSPSVRLDIVLKGINFPSNRGVNVDVEGSVLNSLGFGISEYSNLKGICLILLDYFISVFQSGKRISMRQSALSVIVELIKSNQDLKLASFLFKNYDKEKTMKIAMLKSIIDIVEHFFDQFSHDENLENSYSELYYLAFQTCAQFLQDINLKVCEKALSTCLKLLELNPYYQNLPLPTKSEVHEMLKHIKNKAIIAKKWRSELIEKLSPLGIELSAVLKQFQQLPLELQSLYDSVEGCCELTSSNGEPHSMPMTSDTFGNEFGLGAWLYDSSFWEEQLKRAQNVQKFVCGLISDKVVHILSNLIQRAVNDEAMCLNEVISNTVEFCINSAADATVILRTIPNTLLKNTSIIQQVAYLVFGSKFNQRIKSIPQVALQLSKYCSCSHNLGEICSRIINAAIMEWKNDENFMKELILISEALFRRVCSAVNIENCDQLKLIYGASAALKSFCQSKVIQPTKEMVLQLLKAVVLLSDIISNNKGVDTKDVVSVNNTRQDLVQNYMIICGYLISNLHQPEQQFLIEFFLNFVSKHGFNLVLEHQFFTIMDCFCLKTFELQQVRHFLYHLLMQFQAQLNNLQTLKSSILFNFCSFIEYLVLFETKCITKECKENLAHTVELKELTADYMASHKCDEALQDAVCALSLKLGNLDDGLLGRFRPFLYNLMKHCPELELVASKAFTYVSLLDKGFEKRLLETLYERLLTCDDIVLPQYLVNFGIVAKRGSGQAVIDFCTRAFSFSVEHEQSFVRLRALVIGGQLLIGNYIPLSPIFSILATLIIDSEEIISSQCHYLIKLIWNSGKRGQVAVHNAILGCLKSDLPECSFTIIDLIRWTNSTTWALGNVLLGELDCENSETSIAALKRLPFSVKIANKLCSLLENSDFVSIIEASDDIVQDLKSWVRKASSNDTHRISKLVEKLNHLSGKVLPEEQNQPDEDLFADDFLLEFVAS